MRRLTYSQYTMLQYFFVGGKVQAIKYTPMEMIKIKVRVLWHDHSLDENE